MSAINSVPPHIFEIAKELIPNLPLLIDPAFLAMVLPAAVAPLFLKASGEAAPVGAEGHEASLPSPESGTSGA